MISFQRLSESRKTLLLAGFGLLSALFFLHRWVLTPLGLESFGRIWHLYVNYFEFGLNRRSLEGTLVYLTGLRRVFGVYEFGYIWQSLKLLVLTFILYRTAAKELPQGHLAFKAALFLSPAFLWHLAYAPGNPDLLVMIFAAASLCLDLRRLPFVLLLCAGVFIHEAFTFLVPGLVLVYVYKRNPSRTTFQEVALRALPLVLLPMLASIALYFLAAKQPLDQVEYERHMAAILGPAAYKHGYWSGYFELYFQPKDSMSVTKTDLSSAPEHWEYLSLPVLYALTLAGAVACCVGTRSKTIALVALAAMLLPLTISYFANDFYRWIAFSASLSLLALCHVLGRTAPPEGVQRRLGALFCILIPMSLLGPIGSNPLSDPFPALRFLVRSLNSSP